MGGELVLNKISTLYLIQNAAHHHLTLPYVFLIDFHWLDIGETMRVLFSQAVFSYLCTLLYC